MRTWTRSHGHQHCGRCGGKQQRNDFVLLITVPRPAHRCGQIAMVRCVACANERVPDGIPPLPPLEETQAVKPFVKISSGPNTLPLDWKRTHGEGA